MARPAFGGLWRNPDFVKLWAGETSSLLGSQVTLLALPLMAIYTLQASAAELGVLNAAKFAPFLLLTLPAGMWIDRWRRRPVLIWTNLGRAVLIGLIPPIAYLELLRIEFLYVVAFLVGSLTVLFDLAYQSYLPSLVRRDELVEGNSKLQASAAVAEAGGPGLGGLLVEWLTAPIALVIDAISYLISVVNLVLIRTPEAKPSANGRDRHFLREIAEGLDITYRNRYLRAIAGSAATYNLFEQAILTIFVLYATTGLGIGAALLGMILAIGSVGALLGSLIAPSAARRVGLGLTIVGAVALECGALLLIPLAAGPEALVVGILALAFFLAGIGLGMSNVHVVSLRQTVTPDKLLGRMNASYRTLTYGAIPLGALLGGSLGEVIGLRATLLVSGIGLFLAVPWVLFSPVRRLRDLSEATEQPCPAEGVRP